MSAQTHSRCFSENGLDDVPPVGGKTASLVELPSVLGPQGARVPDGFAVIAAAVRVNAAGLFRTMSVVHEAEQSARTTPAAAE